MNTQTEILEFKLKIQDYYSNESVVTDGIINLECYKTARYKILWILKEPFGGGEFDYGEYISDFHYQKPFPTSGKMWKNIIHTTFGLQNDFAKWDDILDCRKSEKVFDAIHSIALINLKKLPGNTKSYFPEIERSYREAQTLINEQINLINPDIVICGGTFDHLYRSHSWQSVSSHEFTCAYKAENRVIVKTYHPSCLRNSLLYCNSIMFSCKEAIK